MISRQCVNLILARDITVESQTQSVLDLNVSFVTRNQVHLWLREPNTKAGARGVIVVLSVRLHINVAIQVAGSERALEFSPGHPYEGPTHTNRERPRSGFER